MKRNILFIVLISGGIILGQTVLAQAPGIGISPLTFEITANPGDVFESFVKVYNPSADSIVGIRMEIEDIAPTGEVGHVIVEPAEPELPSLAKWIKTEPEEFTLNPREEKTVKFTISVPENAEPGGHYSTILAGTKAVAGAEGVGAVIVHRVGALVLLTVPGEMIEALTVKDFIAPGYSEYGPIPFSIRFENTGTVHVKPTGFVTVTNWLGRKVADIELPSRNVLPDAVRKIETSLPQRWLFAGKYTATLTGSYGRGNIPLSPTVITFWVFPWKVGLGILAVLILLILSRRRWLAAFRVLVKGEKAAG